MERLRTSNWNFCDEFSKDKKPKKLAAYDDENSKNQRIRTLPQAQANETEMSKAKEDLKAMLPNLSAIEVRRFRIPFHEAMILELQEEGLADSAEYMNMLFELDEEIRIKAGPDSIAWKKPKLKNKKNVLERLRTGLSTSEIAKKSGNSTDQSAALVHTALYFESESCEWFWIIDQLFRSCIKIAENIRDDEGQQLNVIRYLYGRFRVNKTKDYQGALSYLNEVRENSKGKLWNASQFLGRTQKTLYKESCNLLHKVLMTLTRQIRNDDPELSIRVAEFALEQATDTVTDDYIAAALFKLGKSHLSVGNIEEALRNLSKFLAIAKRIPDPEGICNAHMELAFAYKELEDSEGIVKHLGLLRELATRYNFPYKLAQAHYYIGEYLLNKSQSNLATPHLEVAFNLFNELNKTGEADRARCIAGVSKGQEMIDQYIDLIIKCDSQNIEVTLKICHWKNKRIPFWTAMENVNSVNDKAVGNLNNDTKCPAQTS